MWTRRQVLGAGAWGAAALGWDGTGLAAGSRVSPLQVESVDGLAMLKLGTGVGRGGSPAAALGDCLEQLLLRKTAQSLPAAGRNPEVLRSVSGVCRKLLLHSQRTASGEAGEPVNAVALVASVSAPALDARERLQTRLHLGADAITAYSHTATHRRIFNSGGTPIQVDFSAPITGSRFFSALLRELPFPAAGLTVMLVLDGNLPPFLDKSGLGNGDITGFEVTVPFSTSIVGFSSGIHTMDATGGFTGRYFARRNAIGFAAPTALAGEAQGLVSGF